MVWNTSFIHQYDNNNYLMLIPYILSKFKFRNLFFSEMRLTCNLIVFKKLTRKDYHQLLIPSLISVILNISRASLRNMASALSASHWSSRSPLHSMLSLSPLNQVQFSRRQSIYLPPIWSQILEKTICFPSNSQYHSNVI